MAFPARRAFGLERTLAALTTLGDVFERGPAMSGSRCLQFLAVWTDVEVALFVVGEVGPRELAARGDLALIPERDMRFDAMVHQPAQHLARAVGDIAGNAIGLQSEALLRPTNHGLGRIDLLGDARRRCLDIEDNGVFNIDEIIDAVAEHHFMATPRRPGGAGVGR